MESTRSPTKASSTVQTRTSSTVALAQRGHPARISQVCTGVSAMTTTRASSTGAISHEISRSPATVTVAAAPPRSSSSQRGSPPGDGAVPGAGIPTGPAPSDTAAAISNTPAVVSITSAGDYTGSGSAAPGGRVDSADV